MTDQRAELQHSNLEHFPITIFATIMGMSGLTLAVQAGSYHYGLGLGAANTLYYLTGFAFFLLLMGYLAKLLQYPRAVQAEWCHPVKMAFFSAIPISLLLLGVASMTRNIVLAEWLWRIGMVLQGGATLAVISGWISARSFQAGQLSPAWFIPAVGNVFVPIAGVSLGYVEISWYFWSVGVLFWIVLLALVMNRLIFHDPLPGRLQPTLVILIAPPAVAFLAWLRLSGEVDAVARFLINAAYFFTLLVALQLPRILRLPFVLSFWALSFPFAAVTLASFAFASGTGSMAHAVFGTVLLAILCVIIAGLLIRTTQAALKGQICLPD
jgi:tellurite resistance protein